MRTLIVDDDEDIVALIRDSVHWEKLGVNDVVCAYNIVQAKRQLKAGPVDIVISDIEMPMGSGIELLKWFRREGQEGKFLLLTCHEDFSYAAEAVRYHAEEYLLKPFDVGIMELVLQKLVNAIRKEKAEKEDLNLGRWASVNMKEIKRAFWNGLFSGRIRCRGDDLEEELSIRKMDVGLHEPFCLVLSRATNLDNDLQDYGRETLAFILEQLHGDILLNEDEADRLVSAETEAELGFTAICRFRDREGLPDKCRQLIAKSASMLSLTLTVCISDECTISQFYEKNQLCHQLLRNSILYYGDVFSECRAVELTGGAQPVLKLPVMEEYLNRGEKIRFMDYLKKELSAKTAMQRLDAGVLATMRREITQAVYAHLAKKGIQVSLLLNDRDSVRYSDRADQSVIDMIRWVNYLLGKIFAYEEEMQKSATIMDNINDYIREHYRENIGRTEIGARFFLVPEYLAKMYKKKTGKSLKDAINEYRLEQAANLLDNPQTRVRDAAMEVGFDNFSYFSTLFKKYMGMTPNEYRKSRGIQT